MKKGTFERQIKEARKRIEGLGQHGNDWSEQVLGEECSVILEKLQLAAEQLRQREEELALAHRTVEAERWRYQAMFDFAADGYLMIDASGVIQEANQAAVALLSVPRGSLLLNPNPVVEADSTGHIHYLNPAAQKLFPDLEAGGILHPWLEKLADMAETLPGQTGNFTVREVKVGERWYVQWIYYVKEGKRFRIYGADMTERKRMETELHYREQTFRALVEQVPDIVARFDRDLRHRYVNPAIEVATGIPRAAFLGKSNRELGMPAELVSYWDAALRKVFETKQEEVLEFAFPAEDGSKWFSARLVPEFAQDGSVESVLSLARDITERREMEDLLRRSHDELERRVQERTFELMKASELLEKVFSSVDILIAYLDRDFNFLFGMPKEKSREPSS